MELIKSDNPILVQRALAVYQGDCVIDLVDAMWATLNKTTGVGLAANQVGVLQRVILVKHNDLVTAIINPVITDTSGKDKQSDEGCLSYPNKKSKIRRKTWVVVEGFDVNWNKIKKKCRGQLSYIIQHEIDHLDGITIEDNGRFA